MRRALAAVLIAACGRTTTAPAPIAPLPFEVVALDAGVAPAEPAAPAVDAGPRQAIDVHYLVADDAWKVRWTFAEPTAGILFDRRHPPFRQGTWTPDPALRWSSEDGDEVLRPIDGVARHDFTVRFPTDDTSRLRAPPLNFRWRDGSRLLYTGSLGAHALACRGARCDCRDVGTARFWRFLASDARAMRILEQRQQGFLLWTEPAGDSLRGTYLYAGNGQPEIAEAVLTILDGGLPAWLAAETRSNLPILLARYADCTGLDLPFRPLVLVSRGPGGGRGRAVRGRTLPALMQLEARGAWDCKTGAAQRQWFELLAHEGFHFWNSQVARRAGVRDEWWSEGASSYVAGLALREAGLLDERRYTRRILKAANACLSTLHGPLHDEGAEASYYTCGELVHFVVDQRVAGDVFTLYATLFAGAQTRGTYSTEDFVALLADPALVADVEQILERGLGDAPADYLRQLLAGAGIATRVVPARRHRPVRLVLASGRVR